MNEEQPILSSEHRSTDSPTVVVVAGKIGSGKSTALNNIFDLHLATGSSPTQITKSILRSTVEKNGKVFEVIDTPGLGGIRQATDDVVREIKRNLPDSNFILLFCLPVKPSDTLTETDVKILKSITQQLGKQTWDNCVLLLTFSDIAVKEFKSEHDEYVQYLKGHISAFYRLIKASRSDVPEPKFIFESRSSQPTSSHIASSGQIMVVAVGKDPNFENNIVSVADGNWKNEVLGQIMHMALKKERTDGRSRAKKMYLQHCKFALVGAGLGCIVGVFGSPLVMVIGAVIGAIIGLIISILSSLICK